jgi:hypothetical protein
VQIAAPELVGADAGAYSVTGCGAQILGEGASCVATVRFAPASAGATDDAALRIASDAASSPNVVTLSGTGVPAAEPPPPLPPPPPPPPSPPPATVASASAEPGPVAAAPSARPPSPSNRFTVAHIAVGAGGLVSARVDVPGPGRLAAVASVRPTARTRVALPAPGGELAIARAATAARAAGSTAIALRLTRAGRRRLLARHGRVRARLTVRYTPAGGSPRTRSRLFTLRLRDSPAGGTARTRSRLFTLRLRD